jgi:dihydrofolate reductase
MYSAIVAVDNNWGIGYNGNLLISIPDDLKNFKKLTTGHTVVMGLNTWNSLPKKPLPNRLNVVIEPLDDWYYENDTLHMDLNTFIRRFKSLDQSKEIFVMGGGSIYKQLIPYCNRVYVTKIYKDFDNVDTFFPNLDETGEWVGKPIGDLLTYNDITYQYWVYNRNS